MNKKVVAVIAVVLVAVACYAPIRSRYVRPLTVHIYEKESGMPLANIPVYYYVETARERNLFGILLNLTPEFQDKMATKLISDINGDVNFTGGNIEIRLYEIISRQTLYINYNERKYEDAYINPYNSYNGDVIVIWRNGESQGENYEIQKREDSDVVVVGLTKYQ